MIPYILTGSALFLMTCDMFIQRSINKNYKERIEELEKEVEKLKGNVKVLDKLDSKRNEEICHTNFRISALQTAFEVKAEEPKTKEEITTQLINEWLNGPQEEE